MRKLVFLLLFVPCLNPAAAQNNSPIGITVLVNKVQARIEHPVPVKLTDSITVIASVADGHVNTLMDSVVVETCSQAALDSALITSITQIPTNLLHQVPGIQKGEVEYRFGVKSNFSCVTRLFRWSFTSNR